MSEEQAKELIAIFREMQQDISDMKTEIKKQNEELSAIRQIIRNSM